MNQKGIAPLIIVVIVAVVAVVAGAGIYVVTRGGGEPDFEVSANPTSISIPQGGSENVTITIRSINGFSSEVFNIFAELTGDGTTYPGWVSTSLESSSRVPPPNGEVNQTLTIGIPIDMPTGNIFITYNYDENARHRIGSGKISPNHRVEITVTVIPGEPSIGVKPISIAGNGDFTPANGVTSGSGTADDPYIIENKNIYTVSRAESIAIEIVDTSAYFVIRNCYVHGGGFSSSYQPLGISFNNVINGTVENNIVDHFLNGIYLESSENNRISNNTFESNYDGIWLYGSNKNLILSNTVENNSWVGIYLSECDNNSIYHNNFIGNGFSQEYPHQAESYSYLESTNYWDNGYPSGGNYWSNYTVVDNYRGENQDIPGSDGIGDTPYQYYDVWDRYPLMNPV